MVQVRSGAHRYRALIGSNLLRRAGQNVRKHLVEQRCAIISDSNIAPLFGDRVRKSLISAGVRPILITIPAGEKSKTLKQAGAICEQMIAAGLDRQSFVIGLGGGSIGGKTGVNTTHGKNLLGVLHHPSLVIDDLDVLKTLPRREFNQGFAEIIKHGIIADAKMFKQLKVAQVYNLRATEKASCKLAPLIKRNIKIKSKIVAKDERDRTGERALLNFGHTIGHAIERAGNYLKFLHGEALSLGIVAACAVSIKRAGLPPGQRDAVVDLLQRFELPTCLPKNFPRNKIVSALKFDKKFEGGKIRFVVTPCIGAAYLTSDVTIEDIHQAVDAL